jgi:predicted HNH restriction endonuclease
MMLYSPNSPPSAPAYRDALEEVLAKPSKEEIEVLCFQFRAPGRAVTSFQIRDHFRHKGIARSNSLYGNLAAKVGKAVGMATIGFNQRPNHWQVLATGEDIGEHFTWRMRPEVAAALVMLGVVTPVEDGGILSDLDLHEEDSGAIEGRSRLVSHLQRERNRSLIEAKKSQSDSHACEVCGFDSQRAYGVDYCEAHHLKPIAAYDQEAVTRLEDLAIVCANCHRVIHLFDPPLTLKQLRDRMAVGD